MRHASVVIALLLTVAPLAGGTGPRQDPQQPPIKTGVDLVQIDVSVLDRSGNPVRGLTADDFVLLENGKPQEIRGFVPLEFPPPVAPTAPWILDVPRDVVANSQESRRLVVILMDDGTTGVDEGEARLAKMIARAAIDQLGPRDLAAVVFTYLGRSQNFTDDRHALRAAVDSFTPRRIAMELPVASPAARGPSLAGPPMGCTMRRGGCTISALGAVATFLKSAPPGRKLLLYIGAKPDAAISPEGSELSTAVGDMFKALHDANVEVNAFDAAGLKSFGPTAADASLRDVSRRVGESRRALEALQALAENTGGRAVINSNVPDSAVSDIFRRNSVYYLLGFQSSDSKSTGFRKVEVRVNRPDLEVKARHGHYVAKHAGSSPSVDATAVERALAHGLAATDVAVQVHTAMLPTPGKSETTVFVTAGLRQSSDFAAERVTVAVAAFDTAWKERGRQQQTYDIPARPPEYGTASYDVHAALLLRPGRYEIRVAVESRGRSGSVIKNVDVPDFEREPVTLSSVLIERSPAIAIRNAVTGGILPLVPTSARVFGRSDRAAMFVRVHQGGKKPAAPVVLAIRVVDARNAVAFEGRRELAGGEFDTARSADHRLDLPLDRLAPGEYLLQVTAASGGRTASRDARFTVR